MTGMMSRQTEMPSCE